jgi:hypothetical protein
VASVTAGDVGMVVVTELGDSDAAGDAARTLLEHGMGADVVAGHGEGQNLITGSSDTYVVMVLALDEVRAREILGLPELVPDEEEEAAAAPRTTLEAITDDKKVHSLFGGRLEATARQIAITVALYIAALILLPLLAFYGTQAVLTDDVERDVDVPAAE